MKDDGPDMSAAAWGGAALFLGFILFVLWLGSL